MTRFGAMALGLVVCHGCEPEHPSMTMDNGAPSISNVIIEPELARAGDALTCYWEGFTDPDGDMDQSRVAWWVNGVSVAATAVAAGMLEAFDVVECEVTPSDGISDGEALSAEQTMAEVGYGGNVLLFIADDLGNDKVGVYGEHPEAPPTPVVDALAADGVLFRNAYAYPVCSPARGAMLTGRHPRRNGSGYASEVLSWDYALPVEEVTVPEMLGFSEEFEYSTAAIGKWHLATMATGGPMNPLMQGFDEFSGSMGNLLADHASDGADQDYFYWEKNVAGELGYHEVYATVDTVMETLDRVEDLPEPWFLYVAFNAPHIPFHAPPTELLSTDVNDHGTDVELFDAMVESLDTAVGMVLEGIDPDILDRTTVIFVGDNGTPKSTTTAPFDSDRAKKTVYEGGVNIPLIISGPYVESPGSESDALVQVTDFFATIAEIAGVGLNEDGGVMGQWDSISLLPYLRDPARSSLREYSYSERFAPNGPPPYDEMDHRTLRDERWKLVVRDGEVELYDMRGRNTEGANLLTGGGLEDEQLEAYDRLTAQMDELLKDIAYEY